MEIVNLNITSRRLMALAAITSGLTLSPQSVMAVPSVQIVQQSGKVQGTVVDSNGEPIIGATVKVGGQKGGTVTDIDGNFTLNAAPGSNLEISYIGFKTQTIKVGKGPVKVTLLDDNQTLNEVVVVGYGTMRKKDLTGSVVQIDTKKLADQNPGSVQDLLRGTPGLQIGVDSSAKGAGASFKFRGQK